MLSFTERMEAGRELAQVARNRGLPTGKAAKGHTFKRAPLEAGSWAELVERAKHGFRETCSEARAEYDWQTRLRDIVEETGDYLAF